MTDIDDFVAEITPTVTELQAFHNGHPGPHLATWSTHDPVTLLATALSGHGIRAGERDPPLDSTGERPRLW
jgi:hypothetical protein